MDKIIDDLKSEINNQNDEDNIDSVIENYEQLENNNINTFFKLPIQYNNNKKLLSENLIDDLELKNNENKKSIYNNIFKPNNKNYNIIEKQLIDQWSNYYTSDKLFLKDSQNILTLLKTTHETNNYNNVFELHNSWMNLKNLKYFNEKYQYMSWSFLQPLNNNSLFLTLLSYYNLSSPVFSLLLPILMLIIPFFILKFRGIEISISGYWDILKVILSNNSIIKLFTNFNNSTLQEKSYLIISVFFYIIQIYQNIESCIMFYNNLNHIMNLYKNLKQYLLNTKEKMNYILSLSKSLNSYSNFNQEIYNNLTHIDNILNKINFIIKPESFVFQINQIGYIMKIYYQLYNENSIHNCLMYTFGFNIYYNHIFNLKQHLEESKLNICNFTSNKNSYIKKSFYLPLINNNPIKNDISIKKNILITGPNASGKTTILKGFLINQIISQQFGLGCYDSAKIKCYDNLYSYINIPDTSGRDSLFQAEARRCKNILDNILHNNKQSHLCIFDELFSGTNPSDAVETATGFIKFMNKYKNVRFLITTHYFDLCNKTKNLNIINKCMDTSFNDNKEIVYSYKIKNGISQIKAGKDVLKQMDYPEEIFNDV